MNEQRTHAVRDDIWTENEDGSRTHSYGKWYALPLPKSDVNFIRFMNATAVVSALGIIAAIVGVAVS